MAALVLAIALLDRAALAQGYPPPPGDYPFDDMVDPAPAASPQPVAPESGESSSRLLPLPLDPESGNGPYGATTLFGASPRPVAPPEPQAVPVPATPHERHATPDWATSAPIDPEPSAAPAFPTPAPDFSMDFSRDTGPGPAQPQPRAYRPYAQTPATPPTYPGRGYGSGPFAAQPGFVQPWDQTRLRSSQALPEGFQRRPGRMPPAAAGGSTEAHNPGMDTGMESLDSWRKGTGPVAPAPRDPQHAGPPPSQQLPYESAPPGGQTLFRPSLETDGY